MSELWGEPSFYAVGRELHADGEPHIHCFFEWADRKHLKSADFFDVDGRHPNIQICHNPKAVEDYVLKYDVLALKRLGPKHGSVWGNIIAGSCDLLDAIAADPKLVRDYIKFRLNVVEYLHAKRCRDVASTTWPKTIGVHLLAPDLGTKRAHYWIQGPPNCGKTSWLRRHATKRWFELPKTQWWQGFDESIVDTLYADEFKGQSLTAQQLNELADCATELVLNVKGSHAYMSRRMPIIILSNFSPEQCYDEPFGIRERFNVIVLDGPLGDDAVVAVLPAAVSVPVLQRDGSVIEVVDSDEDE